MATSNTLNIEKMPTTNTTTTTTTTIAVITGSTGNKLLAKNLESVNGLDIPPNCRVVHYVVADGPQFVDETKRIVDSHTPDSARLTRHVIELPENTGGTGYLCHRIIAGLTYLVNQDHLMVLDEDNEVESSHIIAHLNAIGPYRWSFTLRSIIDDTSAHVCYDMCESMGNVRPTCLGPHDRLVDTNCFMFRVDLARELAPLWIVKAREAGKLEADRLITQTLTRHEPACGSTREFTVRYRAAVRETVGGVGGSVTTDFFKRGNDHLPPWSNDNVDLYVFHFHPDKTAEALKTGNDPLAEWCLTIFDDVKNASINLIDGYESQHALPVDALCVVNMCHPSTVPLDYLSQLKATTHPDLKVILATLEGPNFRHSDQWSAAFVKKHADVLLTFSKPFLDDPSIVTQYMPHNARFVSASTMHSVLRDNAGPGTGSIAMVLENRGTTGAYTVHDDVPCTTMDTYRARFATGIGNRLTVVGGGWIPFIETETAAGRPVPQLGYSIARHTDSKTPIDTYINHDFALIIENCGGEGATGYISEKIGDALMAGAVPVYWGENLDGVESSSGPYAEMQSGRGIWWLDARECLSFGADDAPLGEKLGLFLDTITPERLDEMKSLVRSHREAYLRGVGSQAYANALVDAINILN